MSWGTYFKQLMTKTKDLAKDAGSYVYNKAGETKDNTLKSLGKKYIGEKVNQYVVPALKKTAGKALPVASNALKLLGPKGMVAGYGLDFINNMIGGDSEETVTQQVVQPVIQQVEGLNSPGQSLQVEQPVMNSTNGALELQQMIQQMQNQQMQHQQMMQQMNDMKKQHKKAKKKQKKLKKQLQKQKSKNKRMERIRTTPRVEEVFDDEINEPQSGLLALK